METIKAKHNSICLELNMDIETKNKSWKNYDQTSRDHTLEGDQLHWLCCALYVACRNTTTPSVGRSDTMVEGNCVSLTRLLRTCKITLHEFFKKMKQWMEIVDSSIEFRERINRLSNSLAVSLLVYEKYRSIFKDLFVGLQPDEPKKNKKTKIVPCTPKKMYEFCWYLFICAKGEYPENTVDLVTSFHMLLCCIDLIFANVITEKRKDLVNTKFPAIPSDWITANGDSINSKNICIMQTLCERHDGTIVDALTTKAYTWRSLIAKYIEKGVLKCDKDTYMGLISTENFDFNIISLKKRYELYVLNVGEIDEGIFLAQSENAALNQTIQTQMDESKKQLMPETPLTRRNYLPGKETLLTPVAMATQSVNRLRVHLGNYTDEPPASLKDLFKSCQKDPLPKIQELLRSMCEKFCAKFETNAIERFKLAEAVYYRLLENILRNEMSVRKNFNIKIIHLEIFHATLIASSVEIVVYAYAYMAQKKFPWILDCFLLDAFNFYKIIEMIVLNHKDMLTRDIIKHLNAIEEQCLDSLAWKSTSPLWEHIEQYGDSLPERKHADAPVIYVSERFQHSPGEKVSKQLFKPNITSKTPKDENNSATPIIATDVQQPLANLSLSSNNNEETQVKNKTRGGSLILFCRKFYKLAYLRIYELCKHLNYLDEEYLQKIWTIFEYSITKQFHLMRDRHLDQILMCSIYVFGRNGKFETTFKDIMTSYRKQPQSTSDIYRDVHMTESDHEPENSAENDINKKYDIIKFYNICYVRSMQDFVINTKEECLLSPLPPYKKNQLLSPRKVSERHSLYIQPLEPKDYLQSPGSFIYSFKSSPVEDLNKINQIVNQDINSSGKRTLPFNSEDSPIKKRTKVQSNTIQMPYMTRKLQNLITDRQENSDKRIVN